MAEWNKPLDKNIMKLFLVAFFLIGSYQFCFSQSSEESGNNVTGDSSIYNYEFYDTNGEIVTLNRYKGKVLFVDFWFTGCGACVTYYQNILQHVEKHYREDRDVVFISISIDKDNVKWLNTVYNGYVINKKGDKLRQTDGGGINLRCLNGNDSPVTKYFNIHSYPTLILFDRRGVVFNRTKKSLRTDGIESVIKLIELAKK